MRQNSHASNTSKYFIHYLYSLSIFKKGEINVFTKFIRLFKKVNQLLVSIGFGLVEANPDLGSSHGQTKDFKKGTFCSSVCAGHNEIE